MSEPMYIESDGTKWLIQKSPSCFVSRNGKYDVGVYKRSTWGSRESDGKLYKCCLRIAAEDGSLIRDYEAIPSHITLEWLKQSGFIDKVAETLTQ